MPDKKRKVNSMATTGSNFEGLIGQKFGRLLVKARAPNKVFPSGQQTECGYVIVAKKKQSVVHH